MGKKKKKTFTNDDEFDEVSTDEEKEPMDQTQLCPHVGKAVNVSSLKKALKAAWIRIGACGPCAKDKRQQKQTFEGLDVWMCLKCGVHTSQVVRLLSSRCRGVLETRGWSHQQLREGRSPDKRKAILGDQLFCCRPL